MTDDLLADEIIARLNRLLTDAHPEVRKDIERLVETRISVAAETLIHPSIQVSKGTGGEPVLGFLGLLNGLVGTIPEGRFKDWGFVTAFYDDLGQLTHFKRTDVP